MVRCSGLGMCGIAGVVSSDGRPGDGPAVLAMCARMVHRGPDDDGLFTATDIALGARRLSIIDVAGGHQPLGNEDGSVQVVLNGELYNFPELREQLVGHGHRFKSRSDTEVLAHAYEEWGDDLVERLNGMFAFAIWDGPRRRLLLSRDRMGIKPLYYAELDGRLVFASELKAMLACPEVERKLDLTALRDYLVFEYVPTPNTILPRVHRLRPGHLAVYERGRFKERRYWDLRLAARPSAAPTDEARLSEELRERVRTAVRLELISDVPIGVLLSGGIDSSSIAAFMADIQDGPVQSFSVGFSEGSFDESNHAERVARHLGTQHRSLMVTADDVAGLMPDLPDIVDEPLGDSSIVPTYLLSRFARQHVTVALGGEGGDEVFGGYPTLQAHQVAGYAERLPQPLLRLAERAADRLPSDSRNISFDFKVRRFLAGLRYPTALRHHIWLGSLVPDAATRLLSAAARLELNGLGADNALVEHSRSLGQAPRIDEVLYLDTKMYLENDILAKTDRASMACSLETRVPLLNRVLVDFMAELPARYKIRGLTTKYLFKRTMARLLPADIVNRPKKGFNFPVAATLRTTLRPLLLDALSSERLRRQGLFDPAPVERLVRQHLSGDRDHRKPLWTLLVFQLWHEAFVERAASGKRVIDAGAVGDRVRS